MSDRFRDKLRNSMRAEQKARKLAQEEEARRRREEETQKQGDLRRRQKFVQQEIAPLLEIVNEEYLDGRGKITLGELGAYVELEWDQRPRKSLYLTLSADNFVKLRAGSGYFRTYSIQKPDWIDRMEDEICLLCTQRRSELVVSDRSAWGNVR